MVGVYVRAQRTPLTFEGAASTMRLSLAERLHGNPAPSVLALILAKTALETARWQALYNHNWGNIKALATHAGAYTCYACSEGLPRGQTWFIPEGELDGKDGVVVGKVWLVPPGHPQTRFRAYENAGEGASGYLDFINAPRYEQAWHELLLGDATGYVRALERAGYFTADETPYARSVAALQDEFSRRLEWLPAPEVPVPERDEIAAVIASDPRLRAEAIAASAEAREGDLEALRREAHAGMMTSDADCPASTPPGTW